MMCRVVRFSNIPQVMTMILLLFNNYNLDLEKPLHALVDSLSL